MQSAAMESQWGGSRAGLLFLQLALALSCRSSSGPPHGTYIAHAGSHLLTIELRDSNRGILRPDRSLSYAIVGDTLIVQADPRRDDPPSLPSRFLIIRDTLRELNTATPLVFVRQRQ